MLTVRINDRDINNLDENDISSSLFRNSQRCFCARAAVVVERRNQMKKSERIYWLVNSLATDIEDGAKASKQIKRLVAALAQEHGVKVDHAA